MRIRGSRTKIQDTKHFETEEDKPAKEAQKECLARQQKKKKKTEKTFLKRAKIGKYFKRVSNDELRKVETEMSSSNMKVTSDQQEPFQ